MTKDEILNMQAGREMDALIAAQVFGKDVRIEKRYIQNEVKPRGAKSYGKRIVLEHRFSTGELLPHYSTDIAAAWLVVEKLEKDQKEILFKIVRLGYSMEKIYWYAEFRECRGNHKDYYAEAPDAQLAICRAALLAVMV